MTTYATLELYEKLPELNEEKYSGVMGFYHYVDQHPELHSVIYQGQCHARAEDQVNVSDYRREIFLMACQSGCQKYAQWIRDQPPILGENSLPYHSSLYHACRGGYLSLAQWLVRLCGAKLTKIKHHEKWMEDFFSCQRDTETSLAFICWILEEVPPYVSYTRQQVLQPQGILELATRYGHRRVIVELIKRFSLTMDMILKETPNVISVLLARGNQDDLAWWITQIPMTSEDVVECLEMYPHTTLHHFKIFDDHFHCLHLETEGLYEAVVESCRQGEISIIEWFLERFKETKDVTEMSPSTAGEVIRSLYSEPELKLIQSLKDKGILNFSV